MRLSAHSIALGASAFMALGAGACDTTPRSRDAAAPGQRTSEIAIRFEAVGDAAPSVAMLAYRAQSSGVGTDDVLPIVDPLTATAPEGSCSFRDVAGTARALGALGGRVDLEALPDWHLELGKLGGDRGTVTPTPHVYPDVATVVGGVVAEAAPIDIKLDPGLDGSASFNLSTLSLVDPSGARLSIPAPVRPRLVGPDGGALPANSTVTATGDLVFGLAGPYPATFLELRPFGATWALSCPIAPQSRDRVVVPAAEVARLASLRVPVSVEAVSRDSRPVTLGGTTVRLTVEVRTSSVVELRP